ncbi:hypothetical protein [Neptunicoccus cionae]|uniref:hypothetical protein n=1 Tax=Neptunicoccus cionae TaxID=2035344 RepID=UPI003570CEB3
MGYRSAKPKRAVTVAQDYNVFAIVQGGRLEYEAVLFVASFFDKNPNFTGRLILGEPQPSERWEYDPRIQNPQVRRLLQDLGAEIIPFQNGVFGSRYPNGNKIIGLTALPDNEPFVFFDTDTIFTGRLNAVPFDFDRPTASMKRENTWPEVDLYGPGYGEMWKSLYDKFELDYASSLDLSQPDEYWKRYLYFNAGWFFYKDPAEFATYFTHYASEIERDPPWQIETQQLYPWLDQIALPLVIHKLGGARDTLPSGLLDGEVSWHYRYLPLLYATAPDETVEVLEKVLAPNPIKKVVKAHEPFRRLVFQGKGRKLRDMFDRDNLPRKEQAIRQQIKKANMWYR